MDYAGIRRPTLANDGQCKSTKAYTGQQLHRAVHATRRVFFFVLFYYRTVLDSFLNYCACFLKCKCAPDAQGLSTNPGFIRQPAAGVRVGGGVWVGLDSCPTRIHTPGKPVHLSAGFRYPW